MTPDPPALAPVLLGPMLLTRTLRRVHLLHGPLDQQRLLGCPDVETMFLHLHFYYYLDLLEFKFIPVSNLRRHEHVVFVT